MTPGSGIRSICRSSAHAPTAMAALGAKWYTVCENPDPSWEDTVRDTYDKKAFFSRHINDNMDSLYSLAMRLTQNSADAEDLVAEAATKAWTAIENLADEGSFRPWIFRILHNCYISDYRKKRARPNESSFDEAPVAEDGDVAALLIKQPDEFLNWWANPEREVMNKVLGKSLSDAIDSLPDPFRVVVVLINVDGLSYDEAAKVLDVSPGTIRSRMNRGRTLLQKALWQFAQEAGIVTEGSRMESKS